MKQFKVTPRVTPRSSVALQLYLHDVDRITCISPDEEVRLAEEYQATGSQKALDKLVNANLRFVISIAKRYVTTGLSLEDLVSEGNIGLITAAKRFDHSRGFKFISYAVWWIRQSIIQAISEHNSMVRIPQNQSGLAIKIDQATQKFIQEHQRTATPEEIAEILGVSASTVLKATTNYNLRTLSLDTPLGNDEDNNTLNEVIPTSADNNADAGVNHQDLLIELTRAMGVLNTRDRSIVCRTFGIECEQATIERIAEEENLTRERVRQIIDNALKKMRKHSSNLHMFL